MEFKHLDYVQNAITRMADNSFKIKGLCVTIVSAFLGLCIKYEEPSLLLALCLPIVIFWLLKGYYLQQERKFRCIYNNLAGNPTTCNVKIPPFSMPLNEIKGKKSVYFCTHVSDRMCIICIAFVIQRCFIFYSMINVNYGFCVSNSR